MIKILIADEHPIIRVGLRQIIATTSDILVAAEAAQGSEVVDKLRTSAVDLLLFEMTMPGISGVDLIRRMRAEHPSVRMLVLSAHKEAIFASRAFRAGADGYLTKDSAPDVLLAAIRKVADGGRFIDTKFVDRMVFQAHRGEMVPHEALSDREFQVLRMLAVGQSVNEIADACAISSKTVSTHKMRLMRKLGLANNMEMIRYAIGHGLTPGLREQKIFD